MKPILINNHLSNKNKKNNKIMDTCIEDYIDVIYLKGEKNMPYVKNGTKINEEDITIPTIYDYEIIIKYNYNIQQLKQFAKYYKLKIGGNKKELVRRIYVYLYLSSYLIFPYLLNTQNVKFPFYYLIGNFFDSLIVKLN